MSKVSEPIYKVPIIVVCIFCERQPMSPTPPFLRIDDAYPVKFINQMPAPMAKSGMAKSISDMYVCKKHYEEYLNPPAESKIRD